MNVRVVLVSCVLACGPLMPQDTSAQLECGFGQCPRSWICEEDWSHDYCGCGSQGSSNAVGFTKCTYVRDPEMGEVIRTYSYCTEYGFCCGRYCPVPLSLSRGKVVTLPLSRPIVVDLPTRPFEFGSLTPGVPPSEHLEAWLAASRRRCTPSDFFVHGKGVSLKRPDSRREE